MGNNIEICGDVLLRLLNKAESINEEISNLRVIVSSYKKHWDFLMGPRVGLALTQLHIALLRDLSLLRIENSLMKKKIDRFQELRDYLKSDNWMNIKSKLRDRSDEKLEKIMRKIPYLKNKNYYCEKFIMTLKREERLSWSSLVEIEKNLNNIDTSIGLLKQFITQRVSGLDISFDLGLRHLGIEKFVGFQNIADAATVLATSYHASMLPERPELPIGEVVFSNSDYKVDRYGILYPIPSTDINCPEQWCILAHEVSHYIIISQYREYWFRRVFEKMDIPNKWSGIVIDVANWAIELYCDAAALRIGGPATILSLSQRFRPIIYPTKEKYSFKGTFRIHSTDMSPHHPPVSIRVELLNELRKKEKILENCPKKRVFERIIENTLKTQENVCEIAHKRVINELFNYRILFGILSEISKKIVEEYGLKKEGESPQKIKKKLFGLLLSIITKDVKTIEELLEDKEKLIKLLTDNISPVLLKQIFRLDSAVLQKIETDIPSVIEKAMGEMDEIITLIFSRLNREQERFHRNLIHAGIVCEISKKFIMDLTHGKTSCYPLKIDSEIEIFDPERSGIWEDFKKYKKIKWKNFDDVCKCLSKGNGSLPRKSYDPRLVPNALWLMDYEERRQPKVFKTTIKLLERFYKRG